MRQKAEMHLEQLESTRTGSQLFLLCWMMYAVSYLGRYNYSGVMSEMIADGLLSTSTASTVATGYFALYGVGQLVHGTAGRRASPFRMMLTGTMAAGCANLLMPHCNAWWQAVLCWSVNGFAQAMVWPACIRIIADILPEAQKEKACIRICSSVTAGTLGAYTLTVLCLRRLDWQASFTIAGVLMLTAGVLWRRWAYPIGKPLERVGFLEGLPVLRGKQTNRSTTLHRMAVSGAAALLLPVLFHGMLRDGITTWLPVCLTELFHIPADQAVAAAILLPMVNLSGVYLAGIFNRWLKNEVLTAGALFCCAAAAILGLLLFELSNLWRTVLLFSLATAAMCGVNAMLVTFLPVKLGKSGDSTLYSGLFNSAAYLGGALSSLAIAGVLAFGGWNEVNLLWFSLGMFSAVLCFISAKRWARFEKKEGMQE